MTEQEQLLAEAREIESSDPDRAIELRRQVAASTEITPAWSQAHLALAEHELGQANFDASCAHAESILAADGVDGTTRGIAGVLLSSAQEMLERTVDEQLLVGSIEAATPYYAGTGLMQLSRLLLGRGDRAAAKAAIHRALGMFEQTASAFSGPGALLRLATLEKEDGQSDRARDHIAAALAHLDRFPLAGHGASVLREKLAKLRDSLG